MTIHDLTRLCVTDPFKANANEVNLKDKSEWNN